MKYTIYLPNSEANLKYLRWRVEHTVVDEIYCCDLMGCWDKVRAKLHFPSPPL